MTSLGQVCVRCSSFLQRAAGSLYRAQGVMVTSAGALRFKHYDPKFRKLRAKKVVKIDLPDFDLVRRQAMLDPDEYQRELKKKGQMPARKAIDRPLVISATNGVFEEYVPPEGDGKSSILAAEGAKQRLTGLEKKGKSYMQVRKIRQFEEDFDTSEFPIKAQDIYIEAHRLLQDINENEDRLHELVSEHAYPQMTWKLKYKTLRWKYIETLEAPRVVHVRTTEFLNKDNLYGQVTVRFHSRQTLALYDRFGRLLYGSENLLKDVLEYVVFEKHLADEYGQWRIHAKIIPDWMPPRAPVRKTLRQPAVPPVEEEQKSSDTVPENVTMGSKQSSEQPSAALS